MISPYLVVQTQVAISTIMMAAARFPEAQAVVHAQLDTVVGRDARKFLGSPFVGNEWFNVMIWIAPTFAEWASLTELQAFILEALRWRPVNPFGQHLSPSSLAHMNLKYTSDHRRCTSPGF